MLDAAYYADDLNMSGGIFGWDYGLDFGAMGSNGFGSADIRGCNEETLDNITDGVWNAGAADLRSATYNFADATAVAGSKNAITIDFIPDLDVKIGTKITYISEFLNDAATTIDVDGAGAVNIYDSADVGACAGGEIVDNMVVELVWDGTQYQLTNTAL